jgi:hypothetical protein
MGTVERMLRRYKRLSPARLRDVYSDVACNRLLVGARISLGLNFDEADQHFSEIFSEVIEAAAALSL